MSDARAKLQKVILYKLEGSQITLQRQTETEFRQCLSEGLLPLPKQSLPGFLGCQAGEQVCSLICPSDGDRGHLPSCLLALCCQSVSLGFLGSTGPATTGSWLLTRSTQGPLPRSPVSLHPGLDLEHAVVAPAHTELSSIFLMPVAQRGFGGHKGDRWCPPRRTAQYSRSCHAWTCFGRKPPRDNACCC